MSPPIQPLIATPHTKSLSLNSALRRDVGNFATIRAKAPWPVAFRAKALAFRDEGKSADGLLRAEVDAFRQQRCRLSSLNAQ